MKISFQDIAQLPACWTQASAGASAGASTGASAGASAGACAGVTKFINTMDMILVTLPLTN